MASGVRNAKLENRNQRAKLAVRQSPYWATMGPGQHIGYHKGKKHRTWKAKWRNSETGNRRQENLGAADDHTDPDGLSVLTFWQAQEQARVFFAQCERDANRDITLTGPYKVSDALDDYFADLAYRGKDTIETRYRADRDIVPKLGDKDIRKLTSDHIKTWHQGLADAPARVRPKKDGTAQYRDRSDDPEAQRRRRSSANRTLTILKAALNHAWRSGRVETDTAWRTVRPFAKADAARVRYLSLDECRRLLNACEPDFRDLVRGALLTGCRYGELQALDAKDFDQDAGAIHIKDSKSGKPRRVYLSDEGMTFFARQAAGRATDAPMFPKVDGTRWGKGHGQRPLTRARTAARIDQITFHELRHTYASHAIMAGAPLMVIAENLGHSDTRMVEKHYGHLAQSFVRDTIRKTAPVLGDMDEDNRATVVPISSAARG